MPYKVVQTVENGELLVTFCPENWESGGKLYWPPSMVQGEKLKKKDSSRPGNNWVIMDCEVKRVNLTLEQAQAAVAAMSDNSETEEESTVKSRKKRKRKMETKTAPTLSTSFNDLAEQCLVKQKQTLPSFIVPEASESLNYLAEQYLEKEKQTSASLNENEPTEDVQEMFTGNETTEDVQEMFTGNEPTEDVQEMFTGTSVYLSENANNNIVIYDNKYEEIDNSKTDASSDKMDVLYAAVAVVQEDIKSLQHTLDRMLRMISNTDLKFEEFIKRSLSSNISTDFCIEQITCKYSFREFEEKLKDPAEIAEFKRKYIMVCGSGKGRGLQNCYSLIDAMFTRQFLTECSWSGGSRNANEKICFKSYEHVIDFFYSVIRESDQTFTILECKEFFKNILRNANRRNASKGQRTSAPRVRRKNKPATTTTNMSQASTSVADGAPTSTNVAFDAETESNTIN